MVLWLIYHDGLANENSLIALSNDPVFNNLGYPPVLAEGYSVFRLLARERKDSMDEEMIDSQRGA